MAERELSQPPITRGGSCVQSGIPKYRAGGARAVSRLKALNYDPIERLVNIHNELAEEIEYQKKLRSGAIQELTSQGRPRAYRAEIHHGLLEKQAKIAADLLRYGYGRVPENAVEDKPPPPALIVNLTAKGQVYVANEDFGEVQPEVDDWDDVVDVS